MQQGCVSVTPDPAPASTCLTVSCSYSKLLTLEILPDGWNIATVAEYFNNLAVVFLTRRLKLSKALQRLQKEKIDRSFFKCILPMWKHTWNIHRKRN